MTAATLRTTTSPRRGRGKCLSLPGSRLASSTRIRRCPTSRQNACPEKRVTGQKTASRIFFAEPLKTHPENATQTLGTHQENYGWSYDFASECADAPNNTGTAPAGENYQAVLVTLPDGTQYMPVTTVKNDAQSKILGVPKGVITPIFVPSGENPQATINTWTGDNSGVVGPGTANSMVAFFNIWKPLGTNDFKRNVSPIYDAYGNFEYGASGSVKGFSPSELQGVGNVVHGGNNYPINVQDIQSGINAAWSRGTITAVRLHFP